MERASSGLYQRLPLAPVWVGVAITAGLIGVFLANAWAFGGLAVFLSGDAGLLDYREVRVAFLVALMAGYLPTARHYLALGARRHMDALRPLVSSATRFELARRPLDPGAARISGTIGLLFAPLTALVVDRDPTLYLQPGYWSAETAFAWLVGLWVSWSFGLFVHASLAHARRFSELASDLERIDLFDPGALAPFARQGLRSAFLWLVLVSLFSVNAADLAWFALTGAVAVGGAVAALVLPVRGIHLRLRATKRAELERVHGALRGVPDALAGSPIAERAGGLGLADLLAYRGFVEGVREWPFDSPTLLRFALILALPLGSWLGGALVERLLAAVLD
jgi:hypothetical protein